MIDWLGGAKALTGKPKRKTSPASPAKFEAAKVEALELIESNDWAHASPTVLVGLYAVLHLRVYGVEAVDVADAWRHVLSSAVRMLEAEPFNGDATKAMNFIRWTWQTEKLREERSRGQQRRRLTWQLQFATRHLLVDWLRTVVQRQRSK
jgi:hypothetical protein